jgi:alpha/beta superfamily hydrolase
MTPFYFGSADRRLFGVYDPAHKIGGATRAAVVCYPSGDEQIHAYRTLRQLAARMSQAGIHVLRFDYYGTGDSSGETGEGDIASWCDDIKTAIAELKDMTGATRVSLVGLRLGANLAARVAAKRPAEIDNLVLWEPLCVEKHPYAGSEEHDDSCHIDLSRFTVSLPPRTLVILTERAPRSAEFGDLSVEQLVSVSPWIEERTVIGTIPVDAIHHIVNWLN